MDIEFTKETGRQKGSWKGGVCGTSTNILENETPLDAFRKYGTAETHEKYHGVVNREFIDIKIIS